TVKGAFARFAGSNEAKEIISTAVFSDGFVDKNIKNYRFTIGSKNVDKFFSILVIDPPRAKIFDCFTNTTIEGLTVKDI
ncbi:16240_t:CDS:2, partial [Entrophospora sp. SA101]